MARRYRIGLNFFFDNKTNSGIVNYIFNIVSALNRLSDVKKPSLIIFYSDKAPVSYLKSIGYPYIEYILFNPIPSNFIARKINSFLRLVTGIDLFIQFSYFNRIDCLYPYFKFQDFHFKGAKNKIHWLVDFNNRAFPNHYSDNGESMNKYQDELASSSEKVVLSSYSLFEELKRLYPKFTCKVNILPFASTLGKIEIEAIAEVKKRFKIDMPYFMSPNQFWEHKNQSLVLDAIELIHKRRPELKFKILFSGSLAVERGKGLYSDKLKDQLSQYDINHYVEFMGILDRKDQLLLMKGAVALVQPSLYEGWSTLVEEAKALGQFIILSDLPVHREQITENVSFFDPYDAQALSDNIINQLENPASLKNLNYSQEIDKFANNIIEVLR